MNVLVTSVGSNTSIGIIKSIRNMPGVITIGTDTNPAHLCAGALLVNRFIQTPSANEEENYFSAFVSIINNYSVDCVIPVHDVEIEVMAKLKGLYPKLTFWAINASEVISLCNSKILSNKAAIEAGLRVPLCYNRDVDDVIFPVIIKPVAGVSSKGISIAKNEKELGDAIEASNEDILIQELIEDAVEYTIDAYSNYSGKYYGCVIRERIETRNGMSTKGVVVEDEQLEALVENFLNRLEYVGMSNLQFFKKDNDYYFIEINPRFSGAGVLSVAANFNSPAFTLMEAAGQPLPAFNKTEIKMGLFMTRYYEESFAYAATASV